MGASLIERFLAMKILFAIFALTVPLRLVRPTDAACPNCLTSSQVPSGYGYLYASGMDPCFPMWGGDWCITSVNNNQASLMPCEPSDCNTGGGGDIGGGDSGGGDSGTMTCDNSDLPSTDCSADASYCGIPPNWGKTDEQTMCLYCGVDEANCNNAVCSREITDQADKDAIAAKHNELRRRVAKGEETQGVGGIAQPAASDMYALKWNDGLAKVAQRWADQCIWDHDGNRNTEQYASVGQNMAYKSQAPNPPSTTRSYDSFIQGWYDEVADWPAANVASYSSTGTTGTTGHYTQLVWAETMEIGCGYIAYSHKTDWYKQVLVCNYGIGGNMLRDPLYNTDTAASCPAGSTEDDGLCVW